MRARQLSFREKEGDETYLISLTLSSLDLMCTRYYLGMKVTRTAEYIKLDQHRYTLDILEKYDYLLQGLENKFYTTPMERDLKLRRFESESMTDRQSNYAEKFPYHCFICQSRQDPIYHIQWEYWQDSARV